MSSLTFYGSRKPGYRNLVRRYHEGVEVDLQLIASISDASAEALMSGGSIHVRLRKDLEGDVAPWEMQIHLNGKVFQGGFLSDHRFDILTEREDSIPVVVEDRDLSLKKIALAQTHGKIKVLLDQIDELQRNARTIEAEITGAQHPPQQGVVTADQDIAPLLSLLEDKTKSLDDLNQAFWAHQQGVSFPLTNYDMESWEDDLRRGHPFAKAITEPSALMGYIQKIYPDHKFQISAQKDIVRASLLISGMPIGIEGVGKGAFPLNEIGRAIAVSFLRADQAVKTLSQQLASIADISASVPAYADWPIEEISRGRWGAVQHDFRLLCATANSPEGASRHAGMNHKGNYGLMLCRKRYEEAYAIQAAAIATVERSSTLKREAETKLGYEATETTRFSLRFSILGEETSKTSWIRNIKTLEETQRAYIVARNASGLGASQFSDGDVFDEKNTRVARISYNGRLWRPEPWSASSKAVAEAPEERAEDALVWMVGTRASVLRDEYVAGPDNEPDILAMHMEEGQILIGKDRHGEMQVVRELTRNGLVDVRGGLDGLNRDETPAP